MSIKAKVAVGVIFLFVMILTMGGMGLYYLEALSNDSKNILIDNYETLEFTKHIIANCDSLSKDSAQAISRIEKNLQLQEQNITEPGERERTHDLRMAVEKIKNSGMSDSIIARVRKISLDLQELNMEAIGRKNITTHARASDASTYLIIIVTVCTLAAFTFIVNFPGYIANPITQLTNSIKSIANKNYEERLYFDRRDEFEELASAFNQMAEKMDEYEHSNLAKILFEKKRIETIINRMTDPIIGLDERSNVIFANDPALLLLNLTSADVVNHYAPDVAVNNDLFRSLIREHPMPGEAALIKVVMNGKENYFARETITIRYTPTGENENVIIGQVILLKNITSFKELDLAKTNFIATISHELKTPIASLQMCVKLLQDNRVGEMNVEQRNIVQTLHDELLRLSRITNELLDLSQVETGNIKLNIGKVDPHEVIQLATDAVRFQADQKGIRMNVTIDADIPVIQADLDKTIWVLVNFLTNAIRYSPEKENISILCRTTGKEVIFSVEDKGPGIEEKYATRIFDKFFQVPGTPTGTGLGLAISKEFIEAQGGTISLDTAPGKGSKFIFTLPAR